MGMVVGKRHTDSKTTSVIGGIFLLLFFLSIGIAITLLIYFASDEPNQASLIFWYVLINLFFLGLGIFFCWLIIHLGQKQRSKPVNTITFDDVTKKFKIATNKGTVSLPINSITDVAFENLVPVSTGTVIIPIQTTYGRIVFCYLDNGQKKKIVSNQIQNVELVHSKIIGLLCTYNPEYFKSKRLKNNKKKK